VAFIENLQQVDGSCWDEEIYLCLSLIHEKSRIDVWGDSLNINIASEESKEDDEYFEEVLSFFEGSALITLDNLKWASSVLTAHGGVNKSGNFGIWLRMI
jgi:hypothetical protein